MATSSYTATYTYTVADIKKVLGSFAADFAMMVMSAGVTDAWPRDRVASCVEDLFDFARHGYISKIDVSLWDGEIERRAARYTVSTSAYGWNNDRTGGCIWPSSADAMIELVVTWSAAWKQLASDDRIAFLESLRLPWTSSDVDTSHSGLAQRQDRTFASNGFGLQRSSFGG